MVCDIVYTLRETNNQHADYGCETHRNEVILCFETGGENMDVYIACK